MSLSIEEHVRAVWPKAVCIGQRPPSGSDYVVRPARRSVTILGRGESRMLAWSDAFENLQKPVGQPVVVEPMTDREIESCRQEEAENAAPDMVNHPPHYQSENGIECIDAIEAALTPEEFRGYIRGNCIKYLWRSEKKGGTEDLKKATWYLNRLTK